MHAESPILVVENLDFGFGGQALLEGIDWQVGSREFVALVGPNGSGKSTLFKLLLGLHRPWRGRIRIGGRTPAQARNLVGYVPQFPTFSRDFPITVEGAVRTGCLGSRPSVLGFTRRERADALQALREVGLAEFSRRPIAHLSGGQLQRLLIARALMSRPSLMLLDEPTANVDQPGEASLFELLRRLNERMAIIVISHDVGFVSEYVTRVACLNRGLVCHPAGAVTAQDIEAMYGRPMHMVHHHAHADGPH